MTLILYFICILSNLYCCLKYKESKLIKIFSFFTFGYILCANMNVSDYSNYLNNYLDPQNGIYKVDDIGYTLLIRSFKIFGFKYEQFRLFCVIICLIVLNYILRKMKCNYHYVYFFYSLYGVIMDAVQFRFYLASILLIIALGLAATYKKKYRVFIYILLILATTLHNSFILFLLVYFILNNLNTLRKYYKVFIMLIIAFAVLSIFSLKLGVLDSLLNWIASNSGDYRISKYFSATSNYGFLFPLLMHCHYWFWLRNMYCTVSLEESTYKKSYIKYLYEFVTVSFIIIPLYVINVNFYRYLRVLTIPILIAFAFGDEKYRKNKKAISRFKNIIVQLGVIAIWLCFEFLFADMMESILRPIFGF